MDIAANLDEDSSRDDCISGFCVILGLRVWGARREFNKVSVIGRRVPSVVVQVSREVYTLWRLLFWV